VVDDELVTRGPLEVTDNLVEYGLHRCGREELDFICARLFRSSDQWDRKGYGHRHARRNRVLKRLRSHCRHPLACVTFSDAKSKPWRPERRCFISSPCLLKDAQLSSIGKTFATSWHLLATVPSLRQHACCASTTPPWRAVSRISRPRLGGPCSNVGPTA